MTAEMTLADADPTTMRLDAAVTYFLDGWLSEGPTPDSIRSYTAQLKWLVGFAHSHGKTQLADLTPQLLRAALVRKMDPHNTAINFKGGESVAKTLATATRRMARWLQAQGLHVADLTVVKAPRLPERIQPRLTGDEFKALETAILQRLVGTHHRYVPRVAITRDLALIYLLADTGLRATEVCSLDVGSIDFDQGAVLVVRGGKGKKQRALSLVDPAETSGGVTLKLLADWIDLRSTISLAARTNKLWVSMKGNPLTRETMRRILQRMCTDAGIDGNRPPHAFRRASFTERYLESPTSIRVLASRMGWSDKSHHMIDVYTRGAEVELSRTTAVSSVSARWHAGTPSRPALPRPMPAQRPPSEADTVKALLAAVKTSPKLRQALLRALLGGAA